MLMIDKDIQRAIAEERLEIINVDNDSFKSLSYIARLGKRALIGGQAAEIDVANQGSITLKAGDFVLFNTAENFKLCDTIAGHIGMTSYYARKGLILLAGMHIHPGWEEHLILGAYNASPRDIVLDYLTGMITIEFHQLTQAPRISAGKNPEQQKGLLPKMDKDFLRALETQSLSEVSQELRQLARSVSNLEMSVSNLEKNMGWVQWTMGIGFVFISILIAIVSILPSLIS